MILSIFLMGTLACEMAIVAILYYVASQICHVKELRKTNVWSERKVAPVDSKSAGYNEGDNTTVEDLSPEVIAPNIKKPPRPEGGFGARVSKDDGGS